MGSTVASHEYFELSTTVNVTFIRVRFTLLTLVQMTSHYFAKNVASKC